MAEPGPIWGGWWFWEPPQGAHKILETSPCKEQLERRAVSFARLEGSDKFKAFVSKYEKK